MKITFGKFKGWETEDLARAGNTGRKYLRWGADNLKSPKWAREFERVLTSSPLDAKYDIDLMAQAIVIDAPDISIEESYIIAREEFGHSSYVEEQYKQYIAQQDAAVSKWAQIMGIEESKLRALGKRFENSWWELSPSNFSSKQMFENFQKFMEEY